MTVLLKLISFNKDLINEVNQLQEMSCLRIALDIVVYCIEINYDLFTFVGFY